MITFEGIEGCGKSVQARLLSKELTSRSIPHVLTREPGGTKFGQSLRKILLSNDKIERDPIAELLLYLADRCQHLNQIVVPALERGKWVISDRYHDATLAYQGYARKLSLKQIDSLSKNLSIRTPDVTIFIDIEVELGLKRARLRNTDQGEDYLGRFEAEKISFHQAVREGYQALMERDPARFVRVNGSGTKLEVFSQIVDSLQKLDVLEKTT